MELGGGVRRDRALMRRVTYLVYQRLAQQPLFVAHVREQPEMLYAVAVVTDEVNSQCSHVPADSMIHDLMAVAANFINFDLLTEWLSTGMAAP